MEWIWFGLNLGRDRWDWSANRHRCWAIHAGEIRVFASDDGSQDLYRKEYGGRRGCSRRRWWWSDSPPYILDKRLSLAVFCFILSRFVTWFLIKRLTFKHGIIFIHNFNRKEILNWIRQIMNSSFVSNLTSNKLVETRFHLIRKIPDLYDEVIEDLFRERPKRNRN